MNASDKASLIVKHINPPSENKHPRGWNTDIGHQRKLKSYQVELAWYQDYSANLEKVCKIPKLINSESISSEHLLILEDLSEAGYPITQPRIDLKAIKTVLTWLAKFHSNFIHVQPNSLWKTGCYWHLETRMEEWAKMPNSILKEHAKQIDKRLTQTNYQTIIHGDAKLANFCFSQDLTAVAAVDFQYVGQGCGMKDVVYFIGSCIAEDECEQYELELLNHYFQILRENLTAKLSNHQITTLVEEWRSLYPFAWADFHRFLEGWAPDHKKLNRYSQSKVDQVIRKL